MCECRRKNNGARHREAAKSSKTVKRKGEQGSVSVSVWFYSNLPIASIWPLPYARASYYISLTFAFAEALIECIQHSGKGLSAVTAWPWLLGTDNFSERGTGSGSEALQRAVSSLQIHDNQPATSKLGRRVWVPTTRINFCLSKQLWRQTPRGGGGWLCGIEIWGWCRNLSALYADTLIQVIFFQDCDIWLRWP